MSKKRLLTSAVILISMVGLFFSRLWTPLVFDIVFGALAVIACIEVGRVAYEAGKFNSAYIVATYPAILYLLTMLYVNNKFTFSYYIFSYLMVILGYFVIVFTITMCTHKLTIDEMAKTEYKGKKVSFALDKAMFSLAILIYPATLFITIVLLNHFTSIYAISQVVSTSNLSMFLLVLTFAITMSCDSMAMVTGIIFKGKKLCPKISPNKTISGAIGGLVGGIFSAMIVYLIFCTSSSFVADFGAIGGTWWHILIVGLIGSVISQLGDILASLLKRHAGVKDYGNIFPGHGGVMDRVDGLIFNSAFVLIYFVLVTIL